MAHSEIYNATAERLMGYYGFDEQVVDSVASLAVTQAAMDGGKFLDAYGIPSPQIVTMGKSKPIEVLDIKPLTDTQPGHARIMHLAMGNGLDGNQIYQIATVFAADPTVRTIAFGNPGKPGSKAGILSLADAVLVARGNMRPLIDRQSRYVAGTGIEHVEQRGFSYGDLPALTATEYAAHYDHEVTQVTTIEPADAKRRLPLKPLAMLGLGWDFAMTGKPLQGYVEASGIDAFIEARGNDKLGMAKYIAGLGRATNLAKSWALAGDDYAERAAKALDAQPGAQLDCIWGTDSELAVDSHMRAIMESLQLVYGAGRVSAHAIPRQKHNMVNDIHLQAALLLQADVS